MNQSPDSILTAISWCLAWGDDRNPQQPVESLRQMRQALADEQSVPEACQSLVESVRQLDTLEFPETRAILQELTKRHPNLWNQQIGLVYGGATKIKQYVFEATKLSDIRGASALLDRINLVDLPAFFGQEKFRNIDRWLDNNGFANLRAALIPELIIYSTGGTILAFCPAAFVDDLANAIEKRYTEETLTANVCAVGTVCKPLELRFGLLQEPIEQTFWLDQYLLPDSQNHPLVQAYFDQPGITSPQEKFPARKNFSELVGKLATQFTHRRNGNTMVNCDRPSRAHPPMLETHPYLQRDEGDRRSAVAPAIGLPGEPLLSDVLARKRIVGQQTKKEGFQQRRWYNSSSFGWSPEGSSPNQKHRPWDAGKLQSWVGKFKDYLRETNQVQNYFQGRSDCDVSERDVTEARSLREIAHASRPQGFVAYIYADGNNMGGYIRRQIKTPQQYQQFSQDILQATEQAVYAALAEHLQPHQLKNWSDPESLNRNQAWIHPFEIITIGGDDVLLIVPADNALAIAKTIGGEFERYLLETGRYALPDSTSTPATAAIHRYRPQAAPPSCCQLSMSIGVLITADDTPIYYAEKLVSQLLKSAKQTAKDLKRRHGYYGGTVDFLLLKAVTMISSDLKEFRTQGLVKERPSQPTLKLYAAPYTFHELGGLLKTAEVLKWSKFPRSQLYQLRSFLDRGKQTAILNYRYFRLRLKQGQTELKAQFEEAWCRPKDENNHGNLAPWMSLVTPTGTSYETIWYDLVDLYPFMPDPDSSQPSHTSSRTSQESR